MESIPVIDIAGEPAARGAQHGAAMAAQISAFYDNWIASASAGPRAITERDAQAFALGLLPESRAQLPDLVAEVEGIAEGAGLPFEQVWLLNCFDELGGYHLYEAIRSGRACTTVAATGHSTTDGATYIGQSWDIGEWYPSVLLRIAATETEPEALVYTHPGIVGGNGINSERIALVWNSLQPRDMRNGVPVPFLVRRALAATRLNDAISATLRPTRAIGFNFMLAADFGAVNIEATATRQHVTYVGQHMAHANHYEASELLADEGNRTFEGSSFIRGGRMGQLLDETAGHIDLDTLQRHFRDHANHPGSICAHLGLASNPSMTRAAMLFAPATRTMLVTAGPPCEYPFVSHQVGAASAVA
ncbi:MAG: C45 family autoproteolytic acyltransferase/hydrolase [Thermomicrobiales bacterium]